MVFQHDRARSLREDGGDLLSERGAARHIVRREADVAAKSFRVRENGGVRDEPGDAERNERRGMRVQDGLHVAAHPEDAAVEGVFAGGLVRAGDAAGCVHAHDVGGAERALVDAGRADPHVAVGTEHGEVAAAGCGHAVFVDAVHDGDDLFGGMQVFERCHI